MGRPGRPRPCGELPYDVPVAAPRRSPDAGSPTRLERLWSGPFGDRYIDRNADAGGGRSDFWATQLARPGLRSALEVGCNVGANLQWIAQHLGPERTAGVDVNSTALERLRQRLPGLDARQAPARSLPFTDGSFDLVFTTTVLIHVKHEELPGVMAEIVRCSRRYVLCGEYFAEGEVEVPYRGERDALFKRDYGALYLERHPELELVDSGFLSAAKTDWDDVTYWMLEKRSPAVSRD
jgi:pseudaminic acid biosynthesis-associated methylase